MNRLRPNDLVMSSATGAGKFDFIRNSDKVVLAIIL